jgi:hypothetical protein
VIFFQKSLFFRVFLQSRYTFLGYDMNIKSIMEHLYNDRASQLPPDALAGVFDALIWCLSDNGRGITQVQCEWLEGESQEKCAIALQMDSVFPYDTLAEIKCVYRNISEKWPELKEKCELEIKKAEASENLP